MAKATTLRTPPSRPTDEAKPVELRLAQEQGEALGRALEHMTRKVAHSGAEMRAGEYLVAYAVEEAEGLYHLRDGCFVPGLAVHATLIDAGGNVVGAHRQPFLWDPWLYHYGRNWRVPGDGEYTLRVRIDPPDFPRHDRLNGRRFAEPVEAEFAGVRVRTGQKKS